MSRIAGGRAASVSDDHDLCVRAAWLHYGMGLTQAEVAKRLGITNVKAHRLIARANRLGIVHVTIDGGGRRVSRPGGKDRRPLRTRFLQGRSDLGEEVLPLTTLGLAGARYLRREFEAGDHAIIGFGHGRTLAACVNRLPHLAIPNLKLVSLLGGLTRKYAATPFDVIHRLAERTGAEAYLLPVPMYANSAEDRAVLLDQRGVGAIFEMGVRVDVCGSSGSARWSPIPRPFQRAWSKARDGRGKARRRRRRDFGSHLRSFGQARPDRLVRDERCRCRSRRSDRGRRWPSPAAA